jgi:hypothetical protein
MVKRNFYFSKNIFLSIFQGEANVRVGTSFDNKTDQWLGASLAANDGNIIVNKNLFFKSNISKFFLCSYLGR